MLDPVIFFINMYGHLGFIFIDFCCLFSIEGRGGRCLTGSLSTPDMDPLDFFQGSVPLVTEAKVYIAPSFGLQFTSKIFVQYFIICLPMVCLFANKYCIEYDISIFKPNAYAVLFVNQFVKILNLCVLIEFVKILKVHVLIVSF